MANNLNKFLQGFADEDEPIDGDVLSQEQNGDVEGKIKKEIDGKIEQSKEGGTTLLRPVERIKMGQKSSNDPKNGENSEVKVDENCAIKDSSADKRVTLKLNVGFKKTDVKKIENIEDSVLNVDKIENLVDSSSKEVKNGKDDDLNELFMKSGTPEEHREKWMFTIKKARESDTRTMLNGKVRSGRFRFSSVGELEILPDLDTYGKSSKQIMAMQWQ